MTVTLVIRHPAGRRVEYVFSGITRVDSDGGGQLWIACRSEPPIAVRLSTVAEIALDEDGGALD